MSAPSSTAAPANTGATTQQQNQQSTIDNIVNSIDAIPIPSALKVQSHDHAADRDVAVRRDVPVEPIKNAYDPHSAQAHRARMNAHNNNIPSEHAHATNSNHQMSGEHVADTTSHQLRHEVVKHEQMGVYAVGVRTDTTAQSVADCWKFAGVGNGCNNAAMM